MAGYILAIDQGTTSSRALLFDTKLELIATAQEVRPDLSPTRLGRA